MKWRGVRWLWLVVLLLGVAVVSLGVGSVPVPVGEVVRALLWPGSPGLDPTSVAIVRDLRLQRVVLAVLLGAGLGAAGAGYQGLFRNPLADPFVIGASSGAALGATVAIIGEWQLRIFGLGIIEVAALAGALAAVSAVYLISAWVRGVPTVTLLLAGTAVSSFLGSVVSLLMFRHNEKLITIFSWLMGTLSGRGWATVQSAAPLVLLGLAGLWLLARPLDALTFGEEAAAALGLRLRRFRAAVVVAASVVTAACVAAGGVIGFVGLIAPHAARLVVGARHAAVIPASALFGAVLLLLADGVARTAAAPAELPVGVVTALLGGPFFIYLLLTRQRLLGAGGE